jgi:cellobiose-specific phosphotransferase system component IIC
MKAHFSSVHWGRVLLTGVLVIILVLIFNSVVFLLASNGWGRYEIAYQVTSWSTSIVAILLAGGCALLVARKVEREAPLHGLFVGLVAALILSIFNPDIANFFQGAYRGRIDLLVRALGTFLLMVAAGWLGGVLGSRGREKA